MNSLFRITTNAYYLAVTADTGTTIGSLKGEKEVKEAEEAGSREVRR